MRFFAFHFLTPFIVVALVMTHLLFLHQTGSSNPLGLKRNTDKICFYPYFAIKDVLGFVLFGWGLLLICCLFPSILGDPENYIPANPLVTPIHIQPEWYFLFAYAILRSVPRKLGGVTALVMSIFILLLLPIIRKRKFIRFSYYPINKVYFWGFAVSVIMLT